MGAILLQTTNYKLQTTTQYDKTSGASKQQRCLYHAQLSHFPGFYEA